MKVNFKLRLKNKTTLLSLITCVVAFAYQILGMIGVVPAISEDNIMQAVTIVLNLLVMLGVVVDPTTAGIGDSNNALSYEEPRREVE